MSARMANFRATFHTCCNMLRWAWDTIHPCLTLVYSQVFHLLNALVCAVRASIFLFRDRLEDVHISIVKLLLLDMPGALVFEV